MAFARQLCELLEEKQEPFLLDVYLLENGCSSKRLERISSSSSSRGSAVGFFLRSILSKLVHGKALSKGLSWDNKSIESSGRMSSVFSCFSGINSRELDGDHQWRCIEMEEDSKQLSPVSVLHRFKEENQSSTSSFDSPVHCERPNKGQQLLLDCVREAEERVGECLSLERRAKAIHEKLVLWQRLNGDVSTLTELLSTDMIEFRSEWSEFRPEITELGLDIEAAIFEEIVDKTLLEILRTRCT